MKCAFVVSIDNAYREKHRDQSGARIGLERWWNRDTSGIESLLSASTRQYDCSPSGVFTCSRFITVDSFGIEIDKVLDGYANSGGHEWFNMEPAHYSGSVDSRGFSSVLKPHIKVDAWSICSKCERGVDRYFTRVNSDEWASVSDHFVQLALHNRLLSTNSDPLEESCSETKCSKESDPYGRDCHGSGGTYKSVIVSLFVIGIGGLFVRASINSANNRYGGRNEIYYAVARAIVGVVVIPHGLFVAGRFRRCRAYLMYTFRTFIWSCIRGQARAPVYGAPMVQLLDQ
jgi:hypothetical protein